MCEPCTSRRVAISHEGHLSLMKIYYLGKLLCVGLGSDTYGAYSEAAEEVLTTYLPCCPCKALWLELVHYF